MDYKWKSIQDGNTYVYKDYGGIQIIKCDDGTYCLFCTKLDIIKYLETKDFDIAVSKSKIILSYALQEANEIIDGFIHDYRKNDWE